MAALAQTLAELDGIPTLLESIRAKAETTATKARVALERMAVALEDEEGEFKEPKELKELKMLELATPGKITSLLKIENVFNELIHCMKDEILFYLDNSDLIKFILPLVELYIDGDLLDAAARGGKTELVRQLLLDPRIDPSINDNRAMRLAYLGDHQEILNLILAHPRMYPSAYSMYVINEALDDGHLVERLMADTRVDIAVNNNYAIRTASQTGHLYMVEQLIQSRDASGRLRVDPTALNNEAIRLASANGHVAVVGLLKAHGCVLPQEPPQEPHP
jgi:hypothetical protein